MKKITYALITIVSIVLAILLTWFFTTKTNDSFNLKKLNIFGNEIEIEDGNVFQFSLKDAEIKSDTKITNGCLFPVGLTCENGEDCFHVTSFYYDENSKTLELYLLSENKEVNYNDSKNLGTYGVYDYYISITDIDKSKAESAGFCLSETD